MNRLAIVSLIGLPIAAATAVIPAGASTGNIHFKVVEIHALVSPSATPNSNIVGNGKKAVYNPTTIKYKAQSGEGGDCGGPPFSFTISNTGTATANVSLDGTANFVDIPAGEGVGICSTAPKGEK